MIGIYLITNNLNNKKYVGQSLDIEDRWKRHIRDSKKSDFVIYRAIRKYGIENFSFEVLEECAADELNEKEIYWVDKLGTYNNGYNMTLGGGGSNLGKDCYSDEYKKQWYQDHKEEIKQSSKQYYQDHKEEINQRNKQYREDHKEEQKQYNKQYQHDHREELNLYYKQYREDHKEELREKNRLYKRESRKRKKGVA